MIGKERKVDGKSRDVMPLITTVNEMNQYHILTPTTQNNTERRSERQLQRESESSTRD